MLRSLITARRRLSPDLLRSLLLLLLGVVLRVNSEIEGAAILLAVLKLLSPERSELGVRYDLPTLIGGRYS